MVLHKLFCYVLTNLSGVLEEPADVDEDGEDENAGRGGGGGTGGEAVVGPGRANGNMR